MKKSTNKVKIDLGPINLKVIGHLSEEVTAELCKKLRFRIDGYQYSNAFQMGVWDGYKKLYNSRNQTCAVGLYNKICAILKKNGVESEINFKFDYPSKNTEFITNTLTLFEFQLEGARKAVKRRIGHLSYEPGSGKTVIMGAIINNISQFPMTIITYGKVLVQQTHDAIDSFTNCSVGSLNEGVYEPGDVLVTSYQALSSIVSQTRKKTSARIKSRNKKVLNHVKKSKVLLLDECHHSFSDGAKKITNLFVSAGYKLGFSGTPKPDNIRVIEAEAVLGPLISSIKYDKLISIKRIAKPKVIIYDMPSAWYEKRLVDYSDVEEANMINNVNRNLFIRQIVNGLWKKNKSSYVMVSRTQHGFNLNDMIENSFFVWRKTKLKTRFEIYDALQGKEIPCIISTVGKEGLDLPKLDAVINAEGFESRKSSKQKLRSLRYNKDKNFGYIIDFLDKGAYLEDHSLARLALYESLGGFEITVKKVPKNYFEVIND